MGAPVFGDHPVPPLELMRPEERTVNMILGSLQRLESGQNIRHETLSAQIAEMRQAFAAELSETRTEVAVMKARMEAYVRVREDVDRQQGEINGLKTQLHEARLALQDVRSRFAVLMLGAGAAIAAAVSLLFDVFRGRA